VLKRLLVKNLAIIKDLEVAFGAGLNIITGETGSGKSILIEAIGLLAGGRAAADIIRTGESTAVLEGEFQHGNDALVIRRLVRAGGASKIFLNEEPTRISDLEAVTGSLLDLHGQHEHQSLLRVDTHIDFLDAYAGLIPDREVLAHTYRHLVRANKELEELTSQVKKEKELHELHQYQCKELEEASLTADEELEITREHELLSNADELHRLLTTLGSRLHKDDMSLAAEVGGHLKQLDKFVSLSSELEQLRQRFGDLKVELEDLAYEFGRYGDNVNPDPPRMAEIENRLGVLETIKRKYGGTIEAALEKLVWLQDRIRQYTASDERLSQLRQECSKLIEAYANQCQEISRQRRAAGTQLANEIQETLSNLDMPGTRFEVRIENAPAKGGLCMIDGQAYKSNEYGYDQVEFFLSPNPGEELRSLVKIASGGEISRIMLGIKSVLTAYDPVSCLIFDEIDNGISGSTAETVGIALGELARSRQVICITHLPQIAARGVRHVMMSKQVKSGRTLSQVAELNDEERQREIARLLSGAEITQASLEQADQLLGAVPGEGG
jgi:DNA repair protein RecN (Recombination protein N)